MGTEHIDCTQHDHHRPIPSKATFSFSFSISKRERVFLATTHASVVFLLPFLCKLHRYGISEWLHDEWQCGCSVALTLFLKELGLRSFSAPLSATHIIKKRTTPRLLVTPLPVWGFMETCLFLIAYDHFFSFSSFTYSMGAGSNSMNPNYCTHHQFFIQYLLYYFNNGFHSNLRRESSLNSLFQGDNECIKNLLF